MSTLVRPNQALRQLSFGTPIAVYGRTLYPSVETFDLADNSRLDVLGLLWMSGSANANGLWIGDGIKAVYNVREAAGTDYTLGRYSAGDASLGLTRTAGSAMVGLNSMGLSAIPHAGGTQAVARVEDTALSGASGFGATGNLINTAPVRVYVLADDLTKSRVYARLT